MINAVIEADGNSFNSMNFVEEEKEKMNTPDKSIMRALINVMLCMLMSSILLDLECNVTLRSNNKSIYGFAVAATQTKPAIDKYAILERQKK